MLLILDISHLLGHFITSAVENVPVNKPLDA
jgi:hypothetical protein